MLLGSGSDVQMDLCRILLILYLHSIHETYSSVGIAVVATDIVVCVLVGGVL